MNYQTNETEIVPIPCPNLETWQRYSLGELEDDASSSLDLHLNCCEACNALLERLESETLEQLTRRPARAGTAAITSSATELESAKSGIAELPIDESQIVANVVQAAKAGRLQWEQLHKGHSAYKKL